VFDSFQLAKIQYITMVFGTKSLE